MKICPSCASENAQNARFCSDCGARLAESTSREERKIVTCLFCDIVGFTARAEAMDPEDVRRLLQPYHASVRTELERYGGSVEKFIGDAVMAVFGAPVAHEDDPERAVRAALSIRDFLAEEGELGIRIGITTGEALVALDARPDAGEGMASGDVVNTAARLQTAAPAGSILVDEATMRATERVVEHAEAAPVDAKGRSRPVAAWQAVRARARVGVERLSDTTLVGRERDLELLRTSLSRATREHEPQLVTLVGVPGIGKSRLVYELFEEVRSGELGLVAWRSGRSLPYGEGVTFWALGEIVKAQAGILESDGPEGTEAKLRHAVDTVVPDTAERGWIERHLRPLAGLDVEESGSSLDASEAIAAWRRFLEAVAAKRPLVLVFEDLHWADDTLLDFVDHLVDRSRGVPLLVLCTARPELLARRPGWGGGKVNSSTILLSSLSADETASVVRERLGEVAIDTELEERLLEHAGGNPLYAEEFARMLLERPSEIVVSETVQGLIAARLDTLPADEKQLLQEAAVIGRVFWLGALGRERWTLEERLHSLSRKEFVSRERSSSVAGEEEYVFRHALLRDVAYEQIPKAERAPKHRAAAEWIESLGRSDDHAETLAHHYATALEYAQTTGQDTKPYAEPASSALREAGDRAAALNAFGRARRLYQRALELLPIDGPQRPQLLLALGKSLWISEARGDEELIAARDALVAADDRAGAAEAEGLLADLFWHRGQRERAAAHVRAARTLSAELQPSRAKVVTLIAVARSLSRAGNYREVARVGTEALALAESLGLDESRASALSIVGFAEMELDEDEVGLAALEESIEVALAIGSPEAIRGSSNLAFQLRHRGEFVRAVAVHEEALRLSERFGSAPMRRWLTGITPQARYRQGRWDEALELTDGFLEEVGTSHVNAWQALGTRALIRLARGDDLGLDDATASIEAARRSLDPGTLCAALGFHAWTLVLMGRDLEARGELEEALAIVDSGIYRPGFDLPYKVAVAFELGLDGHRVLAHARPSAWADAARSYFAGELTQAADRYRMIGSLTDEAEVRLRAARHLIESGRPDEGAEQLEQVLSFYRGVEATRFVREGEALLAAAT